MSIVRDEWVQKWLADPTLPPPPYDRIHPAFSAVEADLEREREALRDMRAAHRSCGCGVCRRIRADAEGAALGRLRNALHAARSVVEVAEREAPGNDWWSVRIARRHLEALLAAAPADDENFAATVQEARRLLREGDEADLIAFLTGRSRSDVERVAAAPASEVVHVATTDVWPEAVSDGLTLPCADCGAIPRFDYHVSTEFWAKWVPGPERLGVVCLSCLDRRCGGVGLAAALERVQWTGTSHTVVLHPTARYEYDAAPAEPRDEAAP